MYKNILKKKTILFSIGSIVCLGGAASTAAFAQFFTSPDTTPPWVTIWTVTNIADDLAVVSWTTDEPADGMVEYCTSWTNCANFSARNIDFTTEHTIILDNLAPGTRYYFWMYSRDSWGNLRIYGYKTFTTTGSSFTPTPTPTPPIISPTPTPTPYPSQSPVTQPDKIQPWVTKWSVDNITPFSATINWSMDELTDGRVELCPSWTNCANFTPMDEGGFVRDHSIDVSGLNPGTRYYFWIYSRDAAGNLRVYGYRTFTTLWTLPSTTPTPLPTPVPTATPWPTPFPTQTPVPGPDVTPPWVTRWSVADITTNSANIKWSTDEMTDGRIEYCLSWVNCGNFTPYDSNGLGTEHQINLSGLNSSTRYYFWIYSKDMAGNLRVYGYRTFTTAWVAPSISPTPLPTPVLTPTPAPTPYPSQTPIPQPDTTLPWVMRWTVSEITTVSAKIDWITDEPTDGIIEYCTSWLNCGVFSSRDTNFSTNHSVTLTNLRPGTKYFFWMHSKDQTGNLRVYGYKTFNTAWPQ
jgi:hypothetical protein